MGGGGGGSSKEVEDTYLRVRGEGVEVDKKPVEDKELVCQDCWCGPLPEIHLLEKCVQVVRPVKEETQGGHWRGRERGWS